MVVGRQSSVVGESGSTSGADAEQKTVVGRQSSEIEGRKSRLKITLVKSLIGRPESQRKTVRALGLTRMHQTVEKDDRPQTRGMVDQVKHLLKIEEA
jgi:large subunit ribosomal protein L30